MSDKNTLDAQFYEILKTATAQDRELLLKLIIREISRNGSAPRSVPETE